MIFSDVRQMNVKISGDQKKDKQCGEETILYASNWIDVSLSSNLLIRITPGISSQYPVVPMEL